MMNSVYGYSVAAVVFILSFQQSCCSVISVVPGSNLSLPINSPVNVTFTCNVSEDESNLVGRQAIWEVQDRQIQPGQNPVRTAFENVGIAIEEREIISAVDLIVTSEARMVFQDSGIMIRCTAFTADPPVTEVGELLFIRTYGRPEVPGNFRLTPGTRLSQRTLLEWNRPTNIPQDVVVNYTVTINSSTSELGSEDVLSDQTQFSFEELEMELADAEDCEPFMFHVVASVAFAEDSMTAVIMDTIPLSTNVSSIDESLRVDSVMLRDDDVTSTISFRAVEKCSRNFPVRNYTLMVNGIVGPTLLAMPTVTTVTGTLDTSDIPFLVSGRTFQVGVMACSDVTCRNSITVTLNTSSVQTARAVFFGTNVFLTCSFADGSVAEGCVFMFQVNQNGTGTEEFVVMGSRQCNVTGNQLSGYMDISAFDLGSNQVPITVDTMVINSEKDFTDATECTVQQDVVPDNGRAVSIAVTIVVVLLMIAVLVVVMTVFFVYRKLAKKPAKLSQSDSPDTLFLDIASDNKKLLNHSPLTRRNTVPVLQSLPLTARPMALNPQVSLPVHSGQLQSTLNFSVPSTRAAPIEVELHRDSIKLKVNKTALRAVARFQYMAKHHANDGSLESEEGQSLLAMSNVSRVHMSDDFKSLCCDLPPVEEGGEEEEELRSWGIINMPPLSPPHKQ